MENLRVSRTHLLGNLQNIIRGQGHHSGRSSPIHLVNDDPQPIARPRKDRSAQANVLNDKLFSWLFDHRIHPTATQGGFTV